MLHAVPGIIEEGDIGPLDRGGERLDGLLHRRAIGIEAHRSLEAEALQGGRHVFRVVARVRQRRHVAVVGVADHQGDALFGQRRRKP